MRRAARACTAAAVVLVIGCRPALRPPPGTGVALTRVDALPAFDDDGDRGALASALQASVVYYRHLPADLPVHFGPDTVPAGDMAAALAALGEVMAANRGPEELARVIRRRFRVYRAPPAVLFTGYYLPVVSARTAPDERFRVPVLGRPPDLVTVAPQDFGVTCGSQPLVGRIAGNRLVPYFTRAEIAAGAMPAAPVLAWVDDPVALFFLQIQGAGTLLFPDGVRRTIGFAASNGRPYVSIAKLLIDEGKLTPETASMQDLRSWIAEHPGERERILEANPRYVFFRPLAEVVGSLGVPVTAGRTIATDPAVYPPGALAWIRIDGSGGQPAQATSAPGVPRRGRLVLNQDAGAAIRGPARVDVFFGAGADAEAIAGRLKNRGDLFFLAPR